MRKYEKKLLQIKEDNQQYEAFQSSDNTVVLAGPGSGKTTVLTMKIVNLLMEIKEPRGLACVTFSNEAAKEFKKRLRELGVRERNNVFLGTVHSFCIAEVLIPFAKLYPHYGIPLPLRIISNKKKNILFQQVRAELGIQERDLSSTEMDSERSSSLSGQSKVNIATYDLAAKAAVLYEEKLMKMGVVDFISIVKFATQFIQNEEYVRNCLEAKFPWILIDEYQDLGRPLHEMILALMKGTKSHFFSVGDPDQSIYGFNGAVPDYLLELYALPNMRSIKLETNYRSNQDIINASEIALNSPVKRNYQAGTRINEKARFDFHVCEGEIHEQYEHVVNWVIPNCLESGIPREEIAVLVAGKAELKGLSELFDEKGIPYYLVKHEFERTQVVMWLENCSLWLSNSQEVSFESLFLFWKSLLIKHDIDISGKRIMVEKRKLYDLLKTSEAKSENLCEWIECLLDKSGLKQLLDKSDTYPDEVDNLENLLNVAREGKFTSFSIRDFGQLGKPSKQVTISTRHSSKGLEFEAVILLGLEEGYFPSFRSTTQRKIEEEHRILFVCVSRAKSRCYLVRSKIRNGRWKQPSIFWKALFDWDTQRP
ncbi:ATP-dependent helicase [Paenibacillus thalictri]|uniref:DNA 3'-5' helicase n=1 Tax=Paenibacillus thalictri TaxID=2527873 RepID=A0A4Q9DV07_9BACL|nr:ATP-dependent helicase [Paenibacillus thalictri]TBL80864.1 ATP-dependent helicase [Paenibacillus thalictri]